MWGNKQIKRFIFLMVKLNPLPKTKNMFLILIKRTLTLGIKSLWMHRMRSVLTTLGVIPGVSSVIAMLAVGEGASQHAQEQIDRMGSRNIIIKAVKPIKDRDAGNSSRSVSVYGLTYDDVERFRNRIPNVEAVVPIRRLSEFALYKYVRIPIEVVGTTPLFPKLSRTITHVGRFISNDDLQYKQDICIIDDSVVKELFVLESGIGKDIKIGNGFYEVVGIIEGTIFESTELAEGRSVSPESDQGGAHVGRIYIPVTTARERFSERTSSWSSSGISGEKVELQEVIVSVMEIEDVFPTRYILESLLDEYHDKADYEVIVPLELLKEAERTKFIFNAILGSIAAISLVVGGIGIMNIMLATVSERTREIGVRRALGARKQDIITQFLSETMLLTLTGGLFGICLGCVIPLLVTYSGKMPTVITGESVVLAFGISVLTGIIFGLYPAYRAASMDPIESLRHE
jgi:putative ABC transport system permease protein